MDLRHPLIFEKFLNSLTIKQNSMNLQYIILHNKVELLQTFESFIEDKKIPKNYVIKTIFLKRHNKLFD